MIVALKSNVINSNNIDTITSMGFQIGASANTVQIESATVGRLNCNSIKPNVLNITTQSYSPTVAELLNATTIIFSFTTSNPSTFNDIITITLPTPTAELEGIYISFRKIRGTFNTASTNLSFVSPSLSIIQSNATLTTNGAGRGLLNTNTTLFKFIVFEYTGVYYYSIA